MATTIQSYKTAVSNFLQQFREEYEAPVRFFMDKSLRDKLNKETYVTRSPGPTGTNDGVMFGIPYKVHDGNWCELTVIGEHGTVRIQFFNS